MVVNSGSIRSVYLKEVLYLELSKIADWANAIIDAEKAIESASISGYDNMKHIIDGIQKLSSVVIDMNRVIQEAMKDEA